MIMKPLNIFILGKDRECQTKALIDSLYKHLKNHIPINITVFYDDSNRETYFHVISYKKFLKEYPHVNFINVNYSTEPPNIENYFVPNEYNLVLPDTTIFTIDFDITHLSSISEDDILDLFKGLNRQKLSINNESSKFLSEVHTWKREGNVYSIEKEGIAFEQLPKTIPHKYYGKIFFHNTNITFENKKIYFYPLSPCFINAINKVNDFIDYYNIELPKEYNAYAFSTRYMCGEYIDINEIANYTPNSVLHQYPYKFKKSE